MKISQAARGILVHGSFLTMRPRIANASAQVSFTRALMSSEIFVENGRPCFN